MPPQAPDTAPETVEQEEVGARKRVGYLLRHSKLWVVALILLLLAVAVAAGSLALFTSSSANPENVASAGTLSQTNSSKGVAILTAQKLVPDATGTGTVTIKNTGDVDGTFRLSHQDLTNFAKTGAAVVNGDPKFSDVLNLKVVDDSTSKTVYDGPIANLTTQTIAGTSGAGSKWKPGESHNFTFTVHFVPTATDAQDNQYQGTKTTVQYNWDATS